MSVWRAREAKNVETYGSARWAMREEVRAAGLLGADGVVLGKLGRDYLRHDGPEHVLCFAPTRSGKGVGLVVPSLLTWPGSAIVHDIKGENWQLTAGWRARHGRVPAVRPDQPAIARLQSAAGGSARGDGRSATSRTSPTSWSTPKARSSKRNHWEKTSHSLLVGAILHVLYAEEEKTLAGVATFLSDPKRPIEATLKAMMTTPHLGEQRSRHPVVASAARELLNKSDNERSGVLSTAMSFLGLYRDPVVAEVTCRCDWRIADLIADAASGDALPGGAALRHLADQAADPPGAQPDRPPPDRGLCTPTATAGIAAPDDARRVPGAWAARLLRVRARLHGGLRHQALPDRAVAQPDREGLWAQTTPSSTIAMSGSALRPTTSAPPSASPMRSARRPRCGR